MRRFRTYLIGGVTATTLVLAAAFAGAQAAPEPVLDMAELMEQLFEPIYGDLTRSIATKPANRQAWRTIFDPARRLAEVHNLLYSRREKDYMKEADWPKLTTSGRKALVDIGEAVRKQDYELTKKRYEAAVEACNACHKRFDPEAPLVKPYVATVE